HVNPELLRASYFALKRQATPGVDGMTWQEYGRNLEERLDDLHVRIRAGGAGKPAFLPRHYLICRATRKSF
ncbi:MAG: hypothetical protein ACYC35_30250, partial [Pirellulales bacterium]